MTINEQIKNTENRPDSEHYHEGKVDVWTFADENFNLDECIGFHRINAIKYLTRYGKKNGYNVRDLEKAVVYIQKLIELNQSKLEESQNGTK